MKLDWDRDYIKNKLKEMESSAISNDIDLIENLNLYNHLNCIIDNKTNDFCDGDISDDLSASELIDSCISFNKHLYKTMPKSIFNMLVNTLDSLGRKYIFSFLASDKLEYKKNYVSNKYLINYTYDFYNKFNNDYDKVIDQIISKRLIRIQNDNSIYYDDVTYLDYVLNTGYILVNNNRSINCVSTLIHETSHLIQMLMNSDMFRNENLEYFMEVNSIFVDFLSSFNNSSNDEYFKNIYNYMDFEKNNLSVLSVLCDMIARKESGLGGFKDVMDKNYNIPIELNDDLIKNCFCDIDVEAMIGYLVSLIISLHMLEEYKKDEEKGIYLYNKTLLDNPNNVITFMKNAEFNYKDEDYAPFLFEKYSVLCEDEVRKRKLIK